MATTLATYEFDQDAMGLGDFILQSFENILSDDEVVVYVENGNGNPAKKARFVRERLTDGSTVVNLVIDFHFD